LVFCFGIISAFLLGFEYRTANIANAGLYINLNLPARRRKLFWVKP
jgi:hypothetical protein